MLPHHCMFLNGVLTSLTVCFAVPQAWPWLCVQQFLIIKRRNPMFRETFLSSYYIPPRRFWSTFGLTMVLSSCSLYLSLLYLFLWKPMNGFGSTSIQREQTPPIGVVSEIRRKTFQYVSITFSWTERFQQEKECMHVHLITNSSNWELLMSCLVCCFFIFSFYKFSSGKAKQSKIILIQLSPKKGSTILVWSIL